MGNDQTSTTNRQSTIGPSGCGTPSSLLLRHSSFLRQTRWHYRHCAVITLLAVLAGCHPPSAVQEETKPAAERAAPEAATSGFPLRFKDGLGREVVLSQSPRRIVSLAPRNTEMLFALGAGDRVVGRTSF